MEHYHYYSMIVYLIIHSFWAVVFTFLAAAIAFIPLIGTVIPASVTMTAMAILAGSGAMPFFQALLIATIGVIVGDSIGFIIGYSYQDRLKTTWLFRVYTHRLNQSYKLMGKKSSKSIFISRFMASTRAITPMVGGMLRVSLPIFYLNGILSAIGWSVLFLLPGFLIGQISLEMPPELAFRFIKLVLLLLIIIWLVTWIARSLINWAYQRHHAAAIQLWHRVHSHRRLKFVCWLLCRNNDHEGQLGAALLLILSLLLFFVTLIHVILSGGLTYWNEATYHLFRSMNEIGLRKVFIVLSMLGQDEVLLSTAIPLFIWFAWRKQWRIAWHYIILVCLVGSTVWITKWLVNIPRPPGILDSSLLNPSFPSGHIAFAIAVYGFIGYLLVTLWPWRQKLICWVVAIICTIVALSQLYLCIHWLTDIIGGAALGSCCLLLVMISYRRFPVQVFSPSALLILTILTLLLTSWGHLARYYKFMVYRYRIVWPHYQVATKNWWKQRHIEMIPLYRITHLGYSAQVLNVQWAGKLDTIRTTLITDHWLLYPPHHFMTLWNTTPEEEQTEQSTALAERLEHNLAPVIIATKTFPKNKQHALLFLWPSNITLTPEKQSLWIGTVYYKNYSESYHFFHEWINTDMAEASQSLISALQPYDYREIKIDNDLLPERLGNQRNTYTLLLIKPK